MSQRATWNDIVNKSGDQALPFLVYWCSVFLFALLGYELGNALGSKSGSIVCGVCGGIVGITLGLVLSDRAGHGTDLGMGVIWGGLLGVILGSCLSGGLLSVLGLWLHLRMVGICVCVVIGSGLGYWFGVLCTNIWIGLCAPMVLAHLETWAPWNEEREATFHEFPTLASRQRCFEYLANGMRGAERKAAHLMDSLDHEPGDEKKAEARYRKIWRDLMGKVALYNLRRLALALMGRRG